MKTASLLVAVALTAGSVRPQVFEQMVTSPFTPTPDPAAGGRAVADFDGDGRPDILLGTGSPTGQLWLYHNEGIGRFGLRQVLPFSGIVTTLDFDGDGDPDVCTGTGLLLRNDAGRLEPLSGGLQLPTARAIAAIDIDGDGADEVLIDSAQLRVYAWNGADGLHDVSGSALPGGVAQTYSLVVFDADFDGDQDFALMNGLVGPYDLRLFRNDGAGQFTAEALPAASTSQLLGSLRGGDLDGDGDDDLLVYSTPAPAAVLRNDGTGHFQLQTSTIVLDLVEGFGSLGDWDLDGTDDLVGPRSYRVCRDATFEAVPHPFPAGPDLEGALLADLDGDLDLDAVSRRSPAVMWNNGPGSAHGHRPAVPPSSTSQLGRVLAVHASGSARRGVVVQERAGLLEVWSSAPSATTYLPLRLEAKAEAVLDAAMLQATPQSASHTVCVCTPSGVRLITLTPAGSSVPLTSPNLGLPTHVASGELLASGGTSLVFGDPTRDGPLLLTRDPQTGFWVESLPTLPPPTPSSAAAFEDVVIADMDGDGDLDIVHELRLLENVGTFQFSVAADLAGLVPGAAERLLPIDFDGDGDRDLLVFGATSPTLLLRNDGGSFRDASFGHLPTPEFAPTDLVTSGDVDGDGDLDLLVARAGGANLLRNDGGVFVRVAGVGPRGVLLDQDADGFPDLFTGAEVLRNRHTALQQRQVPAAGATWTLAVHAWRSSSAPLLAAVAVGPPGSVHVPGFGEVKVWLDGAVLATVSLTNGRGELGLPVPYAPVLIGVQIAAQAMVLDTSGPTLSGAVRERVL